MYVAEPAPNGEEVSSASEEQGLRLLRAFALATWEADCAGRVVRDSLSWRAFTGQSVEQFMGAGWLDAVHPADQAAAQQRWGQLVAGQSVFNIELRLQTRAGDCHWTNVRAVPVLSPAGQVMKFIVLALDVRDRKLAEEINVKRARERQGFLLKLSDELRGMLDPRRIQSHVASRLAQHLEIDRALYAEVSEATQSLRICADHAAPGLCLATGDYGPDQFREVVHALRCGQVVAICDTEMSSLLREQSKATLRKLEIRAFVAAPMARGERLLWIISVATRGVHNWMPAEITLVEEVAARTWTSLERASAEMALRDSESRFRRVFSNNMVPMAIWTRGGPIEDANEAMLQLIGYTRADLLARRLQWADLVSPADRERDDQAYEELKRHGHYTPYERNFRHKDGRLIPVLLGGGRFDDRGGVGVLFAVDLSERKQVEEALRRADRQKDEFLAMLGHELRNPLAPIRNAGDLLARLTPHDPRTAAPIAMLRRQSRQLTRLVDDLLDVSRIARGRVELHPETLDVNELVEQALESVEPAMHAKRHLLQFVRATTPCHVFGDRTRLVQCLANILHNAVKYTEAGGEIDVAIDCHPEFVELRVHDTGGGIAPELLEHIFDLFVQGERTADRAQGGLGIGLSVVRRLLNMHHGDVRAHSPGPGKGSTFVVRLPRTAKHEHPTDVVRHAQGGKPVRVLVVDDNPDAADAVAQLLRLSGHAAETAYSSLAALEAAERLQPDAIVLDVGLPHLDGYEVARRLRANPATRAAFIIGLTGYGQPENIERARAAGFDEYLIKPADPDRLEELLSTAPIASR